MSTLLELAERCEAAAGPDHDLDHAIHDLLGDNDGALCYTASLDAAMQLVPEGFDEIATGTGTKRSFAQLVYPPRGAGKWPRRPAIYVTAPTPALALCAAALRARASQ